MESFKLTLRGNRGWPDVEFLYFGQVFFIEFKRPGEKPTTLQFWRIKWLKEQGFKAMWTDNAEEAIAALSEWRAGIDSRRLRLNLTI